MTDDFDARLRATLDEHADRVESDLTGPDLRRLAVERNRPGHRLRRAAPVLASAAAVAALGITAALLTRPQQSPPPPVQPGGPRPVSTSAPSSTPPTRTPPTPTRSPASTPLPIRPALPSGVRDAGTMTPSRSLPIGRVEVSRVRSSQTSTVRPGRSTVQTRTSGR